MSEYRHDAADQTSDRPCKPEESRLVLWYEKHDKACDRSDDHDGPADRSDALARLACAL